MASWLSHFPQSVSFYSCREVGYKLHCYISFGIQVEKLEIAFLIIISPITIFLFWLAQIVYFDRYFFDFIIYFFIFLLRMVFDNFKN